MTARPVLPSTEVRASALQMSYFSALHSSARTHRCRRFACTLTGANARLAEKRGLVAPSLRGTFTLCHMPVSLAHYPRVPPGIPQSARQSRFPPPLTPLTPRGPPPRLPPGPAIEGPAACGRRVAVPSRLPAARLPVEFAAGAPACAPLRRRSRHSDPFRAGIHRRLAGSGPLAAS